MNSHISIVLHSILRPILGLDPRFGKHWSSVRPTLEDDAGINQAGFHQIKLVRTFTTGKVLIMLLTFPNLVGGLSFVQEVAAVRHS